MCINHSTIQEYQEVGGLAQSVARVVCNDEVKGSKPLFSIFFAIGLRINFITHNYACFLKCAGHWSSGMIVH